MELGCDPHGYSRAGYDTVIWYCAIAVGRPSLELNKMREVCIFVFCFGHNFYAIFHKVIHLVFISFHTKVKSWLPLLGGIWVLIGFLVK